MTDLDTLVFTLHKRWSPDAAQEALVAYLVRVGTPREPRSPLAFCSTVAWRYEARERYPFVSHGHPSTRGSKRLVPLDDLGRHGALEPTQLRRAEAREELERLARMGVPLVDPPERRPHHD